jgi:hypothetical protein
VVDRAGTVDVLGLRVGEDGLCIRRVEAHMPTMVVVGAALGAVPPLVLIAVLTGAMGLGLGGGMKAGAVGVPELSVAAIFAVVAVLLVSPMAMTKPLLRAWCTLDARYEITPSGVCRTRHRPRRSLVFRRPPDESFTWDQVAWGVDLEPMGGLSSPAHLWTRKVPLHDGHGSFVIPATSDWLNPWPAVPALGREAGSPPNVRLGDFIVAAIAAFAEHNA